MEGFKMRKLMDWLGEEATGRSVAGYAILTALMVLSLEEAVDGALMNWGILETPTSFRSPFEYSSGYFLTHLLVLAPVMEELMFRFLPLAIVILFVSTSPRVVLGIGTVCALLFGAVHPYELHGKIEVAIAGIFNGMVFLKCGGLQKHFVKATLSAMAAHSATNLLITLYAYWQYLALGR